MILKHCKLIYTTCLVEAVAAEEALAFELGHPPQRLHECFLCLHARVATHATNSVLQAPTCDSGGMFPVAGGATRASKDAHA